MYNKFDILKKIYKYANELINIKVLDHHRQGPCFMLIPNLLLYLRPSVWYKTTDDTVLTTSTMYVLNK
jgi:hypothetical protein